MYKEIKTLAELKRSLTRGAAFEISWPGRPAQNRIVDVVRSVGIMSVNPENGDTGITLDYGKAEQWSFTGDVCTWHYVGTNAECLSIRVLEDADRTKELEAILAAAEARRAEEAAAKEAARLAEIEAENEQANKILDAAIEMLLAGKCVDNDAITIDGKETTVILALAERYGVKIPLRTKGWIIQRLRHVKTDGQSTQYWYTGKKGNTSSVVCEYVEQIYAAAKSAAEESEEPSGDAWIDAFLSGENPADAAITDTTTDVEAEPESPVSEKATAPEQAESPVRVLTELEKKAIEIAEKYKNLPLQDRVDIIAQAFGCTTGKIETSPCRGTWRGTSDISIRFDNGASLYIANKRTPQAKTVKVQSEWVNAALVKYNPEIVRATKEAATTALRAREVKDNEIAAKKGLKPYMLLNVEFGDGADGKSGHMGWYYVTLAVDGKICAHIETGLNYDILDGKVSENPTRENYFTAGALKETDIDYVFNNVGFSSTSDLYSLPLRDDVRERAEKTLAERESEMAAADFPTGGQPELSENLAGAGTEKDTFKNITVSEGVTAEIPADAGTAQAFYMKGAESRMLKPTVRLTPGSYILPKNATIIGTRAVKDTDTGKTGVLVRHNATGLYSLYSPGGHLKINPHEARRYERMYCNTS